MKKTFWSNRTENDILEKTRGQNGPHSKKVKHTFDMDFLHRVGSRKLQTRLFDSAASDIVMHENSMKIRIRINK